MKNTKKAWIATFLLGGALMIPSLPADAEDAPVGFVKSVSGWAMITHGPITSAAIVGSAVYSGDTLETSLFGALGVTFKDNTRVSIGPFTRVSVVNFTFVPAQRQYGFVLRLLAGTMQYISGLTAKLAPDAMQIQTPTATVAVRGSRFVVRAD